MLYVSELGSCAIGDLNMLELMAGQRWTARTRQLVV